MSCDFFGKLKPNYTNEELEKALIIAVVEAEKKALYIFKERILLAFLDHNGDIPDSIMESIYKKHTADILHEMQIHFSNESFILSKVEALQNDPSLMGLDDVNELFSGFFHSGFVFALYWYALTGEEANPSIIVSINHSHADSIQQTLEAAARELEREQKISSVAKTQTASQKSSFPYWILMLILGFITGLIIYMANN